MPYHLIGKILNKITISIRLQQRSIIRNPRVLTVQKATLKELYWILTTTIEHKPTSQKYFEKKFTELSLDWKEIYMTPRIDSSNTYMRCFQYKVLNNVPFLNKKLFLFKKSNSQWCFFCKEEDETVFYLYLYCTNVRNLWNQLKFYLAEDLTLPPQTLQAAVFGFSEKDNTENVILYNHLFLIFKLYVYRSREKRLLNVMSLVNQIIKIKKIEKENSLYSEKKRHKYNKKWCKTDLK